MKVNTILLLGIFISLTSHAQLITHGPLIGGVTHEAARVYVRTQVPAEITFQVSSDSLFGNFSSFEDSTKSVLDNSVIINIIAPEADTKYFIKTLVNGQPHSAINSFRTFPNPGTPSHLVFATGSCQETGNMKVFDVIRKLNPHMLIHTGDYTYPSYQLDNSYPENYQTVQLSWRRRYEENRMDSMFLNVPIDYINDDDDGWGSAKYVNCRTNWDSVGGQIVNYLYADSIPPIHRTNVKRAYMEYFPGYPIPDTANGFYHSFVAGNCEFFFIDTRNDKNGEISAFTFNPDSNKWFFTPPANHRIIGQEQMNWLKTGLQNSTADWKFIVGGLPFNRNMRRLIEVGIQMQDFVFNLGSQGISSTGMHLALAFAGYWPGYPTSQQELLQHLQSHEVKNVIFISGDTHHNVMDDGTNAGLPEMNASGMSVTGTNLAYYLNLFSPLLGQPSVNDSLWNQGGNGLQGNMNFKNAFGKIEIWGKDSVGLCIVDEDDSLVSCFTVVHSTIAGNEHTLKGLVNDKMLLFPVPAINRLFVEIEQNYTANKPMQITLTDMNGRLIFSQTERGGLSMINTEELPSGSYLITAKVDELVLQKKFIKN